MFLVYSPDYHFVTLGDHVFPMLKYEAIYRELRARGGFDFLEPEPASWADLELVHTAEFLRKIRTNTLTDIEIRRLELPWSVRAMEQLRLMTGGTLTAARAALEPGSGGISGNIGGGFHHAFDDHGEGFCLFNDVALAIRFLQRDGRTQRAAVIDCDAHHGNGTAALFQRDERVFTFSMHAEHNYPAFKPRGSLDIGLESGVGDGEYLDRLREALPRVFESKPEIAFYVAGGDVHHEDEIGGLGMTSAGARERDRLVLSSCREVGVPVVVVLAGGYPRSLDTLVAIHRATFDEARTLSVLA
jgi:acetoin utilization deacetylase AcuC-like enzyme